MSVCNAFNCCLVRFQNVLSRKKAKPRPVISAPFDFKKEESVSALQGVSDEELDMLREKAVASVVGCAAVRPYPDTPIPVLRFASASSPSLVSSPMTSLGGRGTASVRRRYVHGAPASLHPVVLASTEPYTPSGLSLPSSSASSIASFKV